MSLPAGPTETYIPGRVEGCGSALVINLCMYIAYIIRATVQASPCNMTAPTQMFNAA